MCVGKEIRSVQVVIDGNSQMKVIKKCNGAGCPRAAEGYCLVEWTLYSSPRIPTWSCSFVGISYSGSLN